MWGGGWQLSRGEAKEKTEKFPITMKTRRGGRGDVPVKRKEGEIRLTLAPPPRFAFHFKTVCKSRSHYRVRRNVYHFCPFDHTIPAPPTHTISNSMRRDVAKRIYVFSFCRAGQRCPIDLVPDNDQRSRLVGVSFFFFYIR